MITSDPLVPAREFERLTGWELKPEGACRGDVCVPIPHAGDTVDVRLVAAGLGMPLVHDAERGLWAIGPAAGPVLADSRAPDFTLPDWSGQDFTLSSLFGKKVAVIAWAPW